MSTVTARHIRGDLLRAQALAEELAPQYLRVRVLPDGSVAALGDLMFTRALYLGCNTFGFEARYCFEDRALADAWFEKVKTEDDHPTGYIAKRGR